MGGTTVVPFTSEQYDAAWCGETGCKRLRVLAEPIELKDSRASHGLAGVQRQAQVLLPGLEVETALFFPLDRSDPGRVEDWCRCSVGPAYPLLPVSVGSASLSGP
jgi:hypothetical protein